LVECIPPYSYVYGFGCTKLEDTHTNTNLILSIMALASGLLFCSMLALFVFLMRRRRPAKISQRFEVQYIDAEARTFSPSRRQRYGGY
jgi:hypothetical protein